MIQNFSSDKPVENLSQDRFQRYSFSKRIAETIIKRENQDGIVIGIYGAWGEGKTSVQNFIEKELEKEESVLVIKLNPWRYNDEDILIRSFLKKIASVLGKELENHKEKFGSLIGKYGSITNILGVDISKIGESLSNVDLEELKNRINEFLKEGSRKLVIFVDDIDRLDKQEIYSLFRLVKLTGDFSNTTYILSFDELMVASAIGERFGAGNEQAGHNFLEKIIQVPLKIPQAQVDALKKYCFELVDKALDENEFSLTEAESQKFVSIFTANIILRLRTPRFAVRYGNSLSFVLPLLKGEVNHLDLMLIEALKVFYPKHYEFVKNNPYIFISSYEHNRSNKKEELNKHLDILASDLTNKEKESVFSLLMFLFPRLDELFHNSFQVDCDKRWYKEKRIVSTSYFKRYFSYTVIEGELSDVLFDDFLKDIEILEQEDIENKINDIITKSSAHTFLNKIQNYENTYNWEATKKLIFSICLISDKFSSDGSFWLFGLNSDQGQASLIINNLLIKHTDKDEVFEFSKILMKNPIPFEFSYQINNWLRSGENEEEKFFSNVQYIELAQVLTERALLDSDKIPLFEKYSKTAHIQYLLISWMERDSVALEEYLSNILNENPSKVKELLISVTPTIQSSMYPQPFKADFSQNSYDFVKLIIDRTLVYNCILTLFKEEVDRDKVQFFHDENKQTDINILRQFEYWYLKDINENPMIHLEKQ